MNAVTATTTATSLAAGNPQLSLFVDGSLPYTGAISSAGPQLTGFAGRISVNPTLLADPSKLVVYQTSPQTPAGDATRPNFILNQLTSAALTFSKPVNSGWKPEPASSSA